MNRNNIRADGRLYELKALQDAKKASEYLTLCRTLPGYGDVVFPHCACDSRKDGHVIPAVGKINLLQFKNEIRKNKITFFENNLPFELIENSFCAHRNEKFPIDCLS